MSKKEWLENAACGMDKPAPGRFDPEHPAIIELAAEHGLTPEEYLADPNAHSGRHSQSNTLNTTVDEWRAEMEKLNTSLPGKTLRELMDDLGIKRTAMQDRIKKLIKTGRCVRGIGKRIGVGGVYPVAVYQLKKGTESE